MDKATLVEIIDGARRMVDNGESRTAIHTYLCRCFGCDDGLDIHSETFKNNAWAIIKDVPINNKQAVLEWLVVAYQNTGSQDKGFSHICPPRLALGTALQLM